MKEAAKLLQNLVYRSGYLKAAIKEGVAALKPYMKKLEVIHIKIDYPDPSTWRKKKYVRGWMNGSLSILSIRMNMARIWSGIVLPRREVT
jgi:hypothetical protein